MISFIDKKKVYDPVSRETLWVALVKIGVHEETIQLIRSFHQDMKAKIRLEGETAEEIRVQNGLRQSCFMANVLFNLHTCLTIEKWIKRVEGTEGVGISIKYKIDEKQFRCYTRCAREENH